MSQYDVVLFDVGKILVDFHGVEALHALLDGRYELEEVRSRWPLAPSLRKFETGKIDRAAFADGFVNDWQLDMDANDLLAQFTDWIDGPFPGITDLLDQLRPHYKLACLTNINEIYWAQICQDLDVARRFHQAYTSHEIGLYKPDAALFDHVVEDLGRPPEAIVFFDDSPSNVAAARDCGLHAHCVADGTHLPQTLHDLGLLPD